MNDDARPRMVLLGRVLGAFGVRGRETTKGVVASLPGVDDRDAAEALRGTEVLVPRAALPPRGFPKDNRF